MKYLVIARGLNEPDNNTPSEDLYYRVADIEPDRIERYREMYVRDLENDHPNGVIVYLLPLEEDEWRGVCEIW